MGEFSGNRLLTEVKNMELSLLTWLLAFAPVLCIIVFMLVLKWSGIKAGAIAWFFTILIAIVYFGASLELIAYTQVKTVFLVLDVLFIIWTALLFFHVADEAGAIRIIGQTLPKLTSDKMMLSLLLGWVFTSFLQGMGGFGVPIAVAAPLLISVGFSPLQAIVMACIGHGWAVNFGSLATSFQTLLAVTNLPGLYLAADAGILLTFACLASGFLVAYLGSGWNGLKRSALPVLIIGLTMSGVQYWLATSGLWTLGATGGAMAGLGLGILWTRLIGSPINSPLKDTLPVSKSPEDEKSSPIAKVSSSNFLAASPYVVLIGIAFFINLIPPVKSLLNQVEVSLAIPALSTSFGYITPAESSRAISLFGHPGSILLYSSIISYLIFLRAGYYNEGALSNIRAKVLNGAVSSSLSIFALVGTAVMMSHSGMTLPIAQGISQSVGRELYPLVAPFIGALGGFITGSNNNSNVMFAILQQKTAELLGLSVPVILGSQTAGGSLGSVLSPAKVIVGCSTVNLGSDEGIVLQKVIPLGLIPIFIIAVVTYVMTKI